MSNRLTFSLASLIVLIAFGLVFGTTSVMAHAPGDDTVDSHTHPVTEAVTADPTADPPVLGVSPHGRHPVPTLSVKADAATVKGNNVVVTSTAATFTVVINFDVPVADAAADTAADVFTIPADRFDVTVLDKAGNVIATGASIAESAAPASAGDPNEAVVTVATAGLPTGSGDTSEMTFLLQLDAGTDAAAVAYSLEKLERIPGTAQNLPVPGSHSLQSNLLELKLVQTLPEDEPIVDETAPVVTITAPTSLTGGQAVFTITSNETVNLGFGDLTIDGGTADPDDLTETTTGRVWSLSVTPSEGLVEVSLDPEAVADAAGNYADHTTEGATASFSNDNTPPTVVITIAPAPAGPNVHSDTLRVTLDFNERIDPETIEIGRAATDIPVLQVSDPIPDPTDNTKYTVDVISEGYRTRAETSVLLKRGVMDLSRNPTIRDSVGTYRPTAPSVATVTISGPAALNCDIGSQITLSVSGTSETLVAGDITLGAGWTFGTDNNPSDGNFDLVPKRDGTEIGVTSVKVDVKANAVGRNAAVSKTFTVGPVLTIPANSYIVVIRPEHSLSTHLNDPLYVGSLGVAGLPVNIQHWECMPDLTVFFGRSGPGIGGGALSVKQSAAHTGPAIGKGTVGISEIMWASDEGTIHGLTSNTMQAREQWIELHNTNNREVKVTLFARPSTTVIAGERAPVKADNAEIDRMSNFNLGGAWVVKGQNGNSARGVDFVSMYRSKNGNPYTHGDNNGRNAGKWHVSTLTYRTRAASLVISAQLPLENLTYDFKGTPGRSNTISAVGPVVKTNVPNSPIIFNEVANRRDQRLEWIELKNVSNSARDLRNYEISIVTAVGTETRLFHFNYGDNQVIMQPGELLLLVDTDPRYNDDHPVAVGYNVRGGNDQVLGLGDNPPRYLVTDFAGEGLPDDGRFVMILRTSKPDEGYENNKGKGGRISDAVGWHDNLVSQGPPLYTNLWPLTLFGHPNKSRNKIEVDTVHYRRHAGADPDQGDNNKAEQIALNNAGYTGVGYKRHAQKTSVHGGTPGYEDIRRNLVGEIAGTGRVTISEIMFDQADRRYPQWIELYNNSPTQAVNLHGGDHGWRLVIQNFDDAAPDNDDPIPLNRLSGTLNFRSSDVQTILPQQTVIVASTRARNSGSAYFDTSVIFPPTRVFSVWDDARGELGMGHPTDPILSTRGFYIELIDGKNNVSDKVGNLIYSPNRRVASAIDWELSEITGDMMDDMMEDGGRSSILRRYREPNGGDSRRWRRYSDADLFAMGITAEGWVAAYKTGFREVRQTWFGHPDDYGTPGTTGGRVLPVSLSKFRPERLDDGSVVVRWITESELNNAGFNILRSETRDGEFTKINTKLIAGKGTTSERHVYEWQDASAKPNVVYYYQIQDVSLDGEVATLQTTHLRGNVSADGKITTTWGELKSLQ